MTDHPPVGSRSFYRPEQRRYLTPAGNRLGRVSTVLEGFLVTLRGAPGAILIPIVARSHLDRRAALLRTAFDFFEIKPSNDPVGAGGALVDAVRSARLVAALGAICVSALALAIWPTFPGLRFRPLRRHQCRERRRRPYLGPRPDSRGQPCCSAPCCNFSRPRAVMGGFRGGAPHPLGAIAPARAKSGNSVSRHDASAQGSSGRMIVTALRTAIQLGEEQTIACW